MQRLAGLILILAGLSAVGFAGPIATPEVSPDTAASALAVLTGAVLIIRSRRR